MSRLKLQFFGRFQASLDGRQIDIGGAAECALVCYLAMQAPRPATTKEIIQLLWGDPLPEHGMESLKGVMQRLQENLATDFQDIFSGSVDDDHLAMNVAKLNVDAERFETLAASLRAIDLEIAGQLYSDFLIGLTIRRGGFDAWLARERRRLATVAINVFQRLSDHYALAGDLNSAIEAAERLLILEPLDEMIIQNLMRRHAEAGEHTRAIQIYQDLVRELKASLNVEPTTETQELADLIKQGASVFPGYGRNADKKLTKGNSDLWAISNRENESGGTCQVTIRPETADNDALVELAAQLEVNVDHDLNDGLAASIAKRAALRSLDGVLSTENSNLRLAIKIDLSLANNNSNATPFVADLVRPFDDITSAMDGLRSDVSDCAAKLIPKV